MKCGLQSHKTGGNNSPPNKQRSCEFAAWTQCPEIRPRRARGSYGVVNLFPLALGEISHMNRAEEKLLMVEKERLKKKKRKKNL